MKNFCTLFDSNYLIKGLTLYFSLMKVNDNFNLVIVCFDDICFNILSDLKLPNITLVKLDNFEDEKLKKIKKTRTAQEYCWTCTPIVPLYVLEHYNNIGQITYLDADLFFFSDYEILFNELENGSVLITKHRYAENAEKNNLISGIYNVQFLIFNNDKRGLQVLHWWGERCLEWCHNRVEDGKFGDQLYLNDWLDRFKGIKVLKHLGGGVAPWNVYQYKIEKKEKVLINNVPLIFYHFHRFHELSKSTFFWNNSEGFYPLDKNIFHLIYKPYINKTISTMAYLEKRGYSNFINHLLKKMRSTISRQIYKEYAGNIYSKNLLFKLLKHYMYKWY